MKVIDALKSGVQTVFAEGKIILLIYAVNFALTLVLAIPMYSALDSGISHSAVRDEMLADFDFDWWTEFDGESEGFLKSFRPSIIGFGTLFENVQLLFQGSFSRFGLLIMLIGFVYLVVNTFFAGGALGLYADEKRSFTQGRFFSYCGQYFNRFFSLVFMSVILYFVVYKLIGAGMLRLVESMNDSIASERMAFFLNLVASLAVFFFLWFCNMIFDYAKVAVVTENRQSSAEALWIATKFIFRNFGTCLGLYYLIGVIGAAVVLLLLFASSVFAQSSLLTVVLAFMLQQLFITAKIIIRLNFYAGQLALYRQQQSATRRLPKA